MTAPIQIDPLAKVSDFRRKKKVQNAATIGLVALAPVLVLLTYLILGPFGQGVRTVSLRLILLADFVYVMVVASLVMQRVARQISARRAKSAGSRLHLRLTTVFAGVALVPTILVAIFAVLTVNIGLEGWFSDRVRQVVGNSLAAAEAYEAEKSDALKQDVKALANFIDLNSQANFLPNDATLRKILTNGQLQVQRGLKEAYLIDGGAKLRARGERSYLFDFEPPSEQNLSDASAGKIIIIKDWANNEFRALVKLESFADRYLYISRKVDGKILALLDETKTTISQYRQLEADRGDLLLNFGLLYLGFAVILILAAIWVGLWFAERLSGPVGRLTGAAQQVGTGDLDVQVIEEKGDDEIAMLGRYFNRMTKQLKGQRDALVENSNQIERRRRLFDSVLGSVASGVVGLSAERNIMFVNRAAHRILAISIEADGHIEDEISEFAPLMEKLISNRQEIAQGEVKLTRAGKLENLLVRISTRRNSGDELEGYVVAFDDVTDLVSAQRMAAWGDVARRIAHEIKNPLTPIQLSAERLKRKFAPKVGDEAEALEQYADVIIRQTGDLRRIVDEFSKFARMPEPERRNHDLAKLLRDAVHLQKSAMPDLRVTSDIPDEKLITEIDATMISQAMVNLIKNAGEAIESKQEKGVSKPYNPEIRIRMIVKETGYNITISDNGIGLPTDRARLFEPYVTTRAAGTGLGLPIVKKIIEEHGGTLILRDAELFENNTEFGACADVFLPALNSASTITKATRGKT